ncbi:LysR family transcriptional regulator [Achromobacter aegrifaciens]|uniref:HTH-type transcriptional activator AmpR n=1 Tax=Achromobacter aegrifaciens TaxID=1287736 RepID=A0AAD2J0L9_ACHAE|nr:LysR family transcriptional regulator [Achromobacter aegrifaciens]CUJ24143.1 HTH-type transcriptional activator AmpR [Achromobacter aegrifaciens]
MNLRFLETFVRAARLKKMTLAAEELHASQAAISARIAAFEEELGVRVFVREKGKQLSLTPVGAEMLGPAEELLAHARAFTSRFATTDVRLTQISIGLSGTVAEAILEPMAAALSRQWPNVTVHLQSLTSTDIRQQLLGGALDIGLLLGSIEEPTVVNRQLLGLDYVWVCSPSLMRGEVEPSMNQLKRLPLLSYPLDSLLYSSIASYFSSPQMQGFKLLVVRSLTVMLRLAVAGAGYAVLPLELIRGELDSGKLVRLPFPRPFPKQTYFAAYVDQPAIPLRAAMADCICEVARLVSDGVADETTFAA